MTFDRVLEPLARVVRGLMAQVDYLAPYGGRVVAVAADGSIDVVFDDLRMPGLQGVPLRSGVPGIAATVSAGARVLVVFENGDPGKPRATLWEATTAQLVINGGADYVALASKVEAQLTALKGAINGAAVAPADGGALFKANLMAALSSWPGSTASTSVKST